MLWIKEILRQVRRLRASRLLLAQTCPSSSCRTRACARALCESPFPKRPPPPTRSSPDRPTLLPHRARDCKNQSPPARRLARQTRPYLNRNRDIDSAAVRLREPFPKSPAACATRFDSANDTDGAARTA